MITRIILIVLCCLLIAPTKSAGKLDCTKIDQQKFKELFSFKFGGGQKGLFLDFGFGQGAKDYKFKVEDCEFLLKESKTKEFGGRNFLKQGGKKKLGNLKACTKYDADLIITNLATKKDFPYQNVVYTKADNIITLKVDKLGTESADLSWTMPGADSCVTGYKLEISDENGSEILTTKDKKFTVTKLSACKDYKAKVTAETARDEKITSPEISFNLGKQEANAKIEKLELFIEEITDKSAKLTWSSDSTDCLQKYQLKLRGNDGKIVYEKTVFTNSTVITELSSCNNYSVELLALNSENLSQIAAIKSFVTLSAPIENLKLTVKNLSLKVTWSPPQKLECLQDYHVNYKVLDCPDENDFNCTASKIIEKTSSSVTFASLPPAQRFSLNFYANQVTSSDGDARHAKTLLFNTIDYDKLVVRNINEFRLKRTELLVKWSVDLHLMKLLRHYEVFFEDHVMTTNNSFVALKVEACSKNYTIAIRCVANDGYIGQNVTYQTHMQDDDVPLSSLENNIQFRHLKESVMISWSPIKEEESCILYYEVNFNDNFFKTNKTETEINDFAPCTTYEINITPVSQHGNLGITSTFEFTSQEFFPKPPSNLRLIEAGNKDLQLATSISEDDKQCNTTAIEFTCDDITVVVNVEVLQSEYVGKLTGLHPFMKYNCSVKVRNNIGVSESTDVAVFRTMQDAPQPPTNVTSEISNDNSVTVRWTADNSTGFAELFTVRVKFEKTIYENVAGCETVRRKDENFEKIENEIVLVDLEPYSDYSVTIQSQNKYGVSDPSMKHNFKTRKTLPSPPRNLKVEFNEGNEVSVDGSLQWSEPCRPSGTIEFYAVKIRRIQEGFEEISTIISERNYTLNNLDRGFGYEVEVKAKNSEFTGYPTTFFFKTPSGIPLEEDVENWTIASIDEESFDDSGKGELLIRKGIFISKAGEITGIAFLVYLADCPPENIVSAGLLSSLKTPLPSTHETDLDGLQCFKLYQQTEIFSNPVQDYNQTFIDDFTVRFKVGNEDCSNLPENQKYCNGPLAPFTKYGIIARLFTETGYRDSKPIFIQITVSPMELFSAKTIVFGVIGGLIFSSLLILLCCAWCSKKKTKPSKDKPTSEADENLLSFTSYCVIDKNPLPRKSYDEN